MNPQIPTPDTTELPPKKIHNPLEVMQPGEQIICEVKRHPIGMLGIYAMSGFLLLFFAVLAWVVGPAIFSSNRSMVLGIGTIVFLVVACVVIGFVFVANKVYWGNSWVVSSDSLTQISQISLFNKQSSQLSLGNLEDVTTEQHGIMAQLFKYGTLRVETAGERSKFMFPYCPNPDYYAQKILAARETFEQAHRGGKQEPFNSTSNANSSGYRAVAAPQAPDPTPAESQVPPVAPPAPVFPDTPYENSQNDGAGPQSY